MPLEGWERPPQRLPDEREHPGTGRRMRGRARRLRWWWPDGTKSTERVPGARRVRPRWLEWLCRVGWHGPIIITGTLGILTYGHCRTCGYTGQLDSQGNLF